MQRETSRYVALLLPELRIGGAQKVFITLAKDFIARGLRVDLVLLANEGELLSEIPEGVRLIPLVDSHFGKGLMFLPLVAVKLALYLRLNRPDVLLSTLTGTNLLAVIAHFLSSVRTRLVLREAAPLANIRRSYVVFLMRYLYKKADSVIVLTDFMRREMEKKLKLSSRKIHQISNPIDLLEIAQAAKKPLPKDFDCSIPYAIAVGRLAPQKDYLTLLNAFAEVTKTISIRLVILGEGPERASLDARIHELNLFDKVELRGFDKNPYRWIGHSLMFVMSSRWEGYPNVLLEALSLGKPVVTTIYDDSARNLMYNQNGYLVPVGDESAFAEAICKTFKKYPVELKPAPIPNGVIDASSSYLEILA